MPESCGKCMGTLVRDDDVLDARFLAAMWPLAVAGWPDQERAVPDLAAVTMVVAALPSLVRWVLPSIALALAVSGVAPFAHVAVPDAELPGDGSELGFQADLPAVLASDGRAVARAALVLGAGGDLAAARQLVGGLADMLTGDTDVARLAEAAASGYRRGAPATAARLLTAALAAGIPEEPAGRDVVRRLAEPIVGE